jgi:hypothetical protein
VVLFTGFSGILLVTGLAPGPILNRCEAVAANILTRRADDRGLEAGRKGTSRPMT